MPDLRPLLAPRSVAVIGLGHVGGALARGLAAAGARLVVSDVAPGRRALRAGVVLYLVVLIGAFVIPTPFGQNALRLPVLLGPALLILAPRAAAPRATSRARDLTDDELEAIFNRCSNSGRWGADDELGTLNYITPAKRIAAVTKDDVVRVAKQYVTVDKLAIVIVGDRKVIEAPLKATGIAPIVLYDIEGNPAK